MLNVMPTCMLFSYNTSAKFLAFTDLLPFYLYLLSLFAHLLSAWESFKAGLGKMLKCLIDSTSYAIYK